MPAATWTRVRALCARAPEANYCPAVATTVVADLLNLLVSRDRYVVGRARSRCQARASDLADRGLVHAVLVAANARRRLIDESLQSASLFVLQMWRNLVCQSTCCNVAHWLMLVGAVLVCT